MPLPQSQDCLPWVPPFKKSISHCKQSFTNWQDQKTLFASRLLLVCRGLFTRAELGKRAKGREKPFTGMSKIALYHRPSVIYGRAADGLVTLCRRDLNRKIITYYVSNPTSGDSSQKISLAETGIPMLINSWIRNERITIPFIRTDNFRTTVHIEVGAGCAAIIQ